MCYEYDWMQKPQVNEELRKAQERADVLKTQSPIAPPKPAEPPRPRESVPA